MNQVGNLLVGAVIGAVLVGGGWYASSHSHANVAKVGSKTITRTDFDQQLETFGGSQTLTQLIENQLIADGAKKYNITASAADIDQALTNLKQSQQITTDDQLNQFLTTNHLTLDKLKQQFLTPQVLLSKIAEKDVKVTAAQIQDYYNKNKDSLATTPESVTASHILVKTQAEANDIEKKLANGADFAQLAKQYSIDTGTKDKGGDLGSFTKGQMVPEFEKAAFALKPGQISQPVQTQYGWHVIKVTAHKDPVIPTLQQATSKITDILKQQKAKPSQDVIVELAKEFPIDIIDTQYNDVKKNIETPAPAQQSTTSPSAG